MPTPKFSFPGRTVIVTGGAGDIGSALSEAFHARGMNVVVADIDRRRADALATRLGDRAVPFVGDLTDEKEAGRLLDETERAFGGLDVLVNNMAMTNTARFHERSTASIAKEVDVIMVAPLVLSRLAVPLLRRSSDPRIITVTSLGGITPLRETPIYSAAKFGLRGAMLSFALDEENHGIKVSCVLPTATDTFMLRQEALEDGNVLNFIGRPQPVSAVIDQVLRQLDNPVLERYPKWSDSLLARFGMLFPNFQPMLVRLFEIRGRMGKERYLRELKEQGLIEEADGRWRQKARAHLVEENFNHTD